MRIIGGQKYGCCNSNKTKDLNKAGLKVSPPLMFPLANPFFSQRTRCADVPWLKASGTV